MGVITGFTAEELEGHAKGYGVRFDDYVDWDDVPILISVADYAKLVAWCEPYMERRHEVQGAVAYRAEDGKGLTIERVYVMGGNSISRRTTCRLDDADMLRQMNRSEFRTDETGFWHLHPAYYPALSVGDVEEVRKTLRAADAVPETKILHLLMYGDPRGGYQLSGYLVGLDEVNRLPVRMVMESK